jgi:hypothetical protein
MLASLNLSNIYNKTERLCCWQSFVLHRNFSSMHRQHIYRHPPHLPHPTPLPERIVNWIKVSFLLLLGYIAIDLLTFDSTIFAQLKAILQEPYNFFTLFLFSFKQKIDYVI